MNILEALHEEEGKPNRRLSAIWGEVAALNGNANSVVSGGRDNVPKSSTNKQTLSAAGRSGISRKAKARWAKIKAEQSKGKTAN